MSFAQQTPDPARHLLGFGLVVILHVGLAYGLMNGLASKAVEVFKKPLEVQILADLQPPPPPPPPPKIVKLTPQNTVVPPKAYVPPPEVQIPVPVPAQNAVVATSPVIQPVAAAVETAPAPVVEAPPAPKVASVGVACPNHMDVRSQVPYPPQAMRSGVSGEVLVDFVVGREGQVKDPSIVRSSSRIFNNVVLAAVGQFNCVGQGQEVHVRVPFVFKLES